MKWLAFFLLCSISYAQTSMDPSVSAVDLFEAMVEAELNFEIIGSVQEDIWFPPRDDLSLKVERFSQPPTISPHLVINNFAMAITREEQVLGRRTQVLRLIPNNGLSPSWRFWVDSETGLRLAYEQHDAEGNLIAKGRYEHLENIQRLQAARSLNFPRLSDFQQSRVNRLIDRPLLQGFIPVRLERTRLGGQRGVQALRLTLWDGLNSVVLLVAPRRANLPEDVPYLQKLELNNLTLGALGPLPGRALQTVLNTLAEGPLKEFDERRFRQFIQRQ